MEFLLTDEQKLVFKETFLLFAHSDYHGHEEIDVNEFITTLKCLGIHQKEEDLIKHFDEVDDNKDGKINFDQFLTIMQERMQPIDKEEKLWLTFRIFDKNGDGYISSDDLRNVMLNLGENLSDNELQEMMNLGIPDNNGQISFENFLQIVQKS